MQEKIKIGITLGDINGIGPEIILKSLSDKRITDLCTPIIYGSNRILTFYKKLVGADGFNYILVNNAEVAKHKAVNIINCITDDVQITPGEENDMGGKYALQSLNAATEALLSGKIQVMVTAPFSKNNMQQEGFNFQGHTEYLEHKAGKGKALMMLINENLRVALATSHIPVKDVAQTLTTQRITEKIEQLHNTLQQDFQLTKPTIAVLGLNPHSGDNGLIGGEEKQIIIPAIQEAQNKKIMAVGPFAADGFFGSGNFTHFDAILAMYHDQGLVPFKTLSFSAGVNYTAGLHFIRTSPDHGTGFDIAGKNKASAESMIQSIFAGKDIYQNRADYLKAHSNPVKRATMESEY